MSKKTLGRFVVGRFAFAKRPSDGLSGFLLFALGTWTVLRARNRADGIGRFELGVILASPVVFLFGVAWAHHLAQGWPFYWNRYLQPAIPWILVPIAIGTVEVGKRSVGYLRSLGSTRWYSKILGVAGLALLALPLTNLPGRLFK